MATAVNKLKKKYNVNYSNSLFSLLIAVDVRISVILRRSFVFYVISIVKDIYI